MHMKTERKLKMLEETLGKKNKILISSMKSELKKIYEKNCDSLNKSIKEKKCEFTKQVNKLLGTFEKSLSICSGKIKNLKAKLKKINDKIEKYNISNLIEDSKNIKEEIHVLLDNQKEELNKLKAEQLKLNKKNHDVALKKTEKLMDKNLKQINLSN